MRGRKGKGGDGRKMRERELQRKVNNNLSNNLLLIMAHLLIVILRYFKIDSANFLVKKKKKRMNVCCKYISEVPLDRFPFRKFSSNCPKWFLHDDKYQYNTLNEMPNYFYCVYLGCVFECKTKQK